MESDTNIHTAEIPDSASQDISLPSSHCPPHPYQLHTCAETELDDVIENSMEQLYFSLQSELPSVTPVENEYVTNNAVADAEHHLLFGRSNKMRQLSNDELDSAVSEHYQKLTGDNLSRRRSQLCIITMVFAGQLITGLVDSGCSIRTLIDTDSAKRLGLKTVSSDKNMSAPQITVGDGHKVDSHFVS